MVSKVTALVRNVKKNLSGEEIHNLFTKRLDEEMFAQVGAASMTIAEQRKVQTKKMSHLLVWEGYERLRGIHKI